MRGTARRMSNRERMRLAAAERVGHENAYFILFWGPMLQWLVPAALVLAGGWWVWMNVDHRRIVTVAAVLGIACLIVYGFALLFMGSRMRRRVMGQRLHAGWHILGVAGLLLTIGSYLAMGAL